MRRKEKKLNFKRYATQEELLAAHPGAECNQYGPVLKYNGREFVQVYFGQHEWFIISLEDPNEFHDDPGWDGTTFGYAFVDCQDTKYWRKVFTTAEVWEVTPEREGRPVTGDAVLMGDKDKLTNYLGPDDQITKALKGQG
jgi:hypothetical protein